MKSFGFKSMLMASAIALSTIVSPLEAVTQEEALLQVRKISPGLIRKTMTPEQQEKIRLFLLKTPQGIMFDPALPRVLRILTPPEMDNSGIVAIASVFSKMHLEAFCQVKKSLSLRKADVAAAATITPSPDVPEENVEGTSWLYGTVSGAAGWFLDSVYSATATVSSFLPSTSTVATPPAEEATVVRRRGFSPSGNPSDYDVV